MNQLELNWTDPNIIACINKVAKKFSLSPDTTKLYIQESMDKSCSLKKYDDGLYAYIHNSLNVGGTKKIAGFDLDDTLLKNKVNDIFYETVPATLQSLRRHGWVIVVFTNQKGVSLGKTSIQDIEKRLDALFESVGFKFSVFVAAEDNKYRKPMPNMFMHMCDNDLSNISEFMYVGDAAGRKGDHSMSDSNFAYNIRILFKDAYAELEIGKFITSEKFWPKSSNKASDKSTGNGAREWEREPKMPTNKSEIVVKDFYTTFDVNDIIIDEKIYEKKFKSLMKVVSGNDIGHGVDERPCVIFMISYPAAGKSSLSKKIKEHFPRKITIISQDELGLASAKREFKKAINSGTSVILDNTNLSITKRTEYQELIPEGWSTIAIIFLAPRENVENAYNEIIGTNGKRIMSNTFKACLHLNEYRVAIGKTKSSIPMVAYYTARKNTVIPEISDFDRTTYWTIGVPDPSVEINFHYDL